MIPGKVAPDSDFLSTKNTKTHENDVMYLFDPFVFFVCFVDRFSPAFRG